MVHVMNDLARFPLFLLALRFLAQKEEMELILAITQQTSSSLIFTPKQIVIPNACI